MTVVALALAVIGILDLARRGTRGRRALRAVVLLLLLGIAAGAVVVLVDGWTATSLVPLAAGALWAGAIPAQGPARWGLWPVAALALLAAFGVWVGRGSGAALLVLPGGRTASLGAALLVLGLVAFLMESANLVVRAVLFTERVAEPGTSAADAAAPAAAPFKGGRLIGPLERVLIGTLMLFGGWVLIAALIAAKGVVRFPEISRDSEGGDRAEYFLVGSMVSWVLAFGAAGLVWFAVA